MKVICEGIKNGMFEDKYGFKGATNEKGIPSYSIPLKFVDAPAGTKSYAIVLEDKDACPVSGGFAWIHWLAANIQKNEVKENESKDTKEFVQGLNSWTSMQGGSIPSEYCASYGGMAPPNAPHTYEVHVYALDTILDLKNGFMINELFKAMRGHILEQVIIYGDYSNV